MVDEWKKARIEEVAEKVGMGPFGSSIKVETFVPKGIPVISGQHLHGTRLEDKEYNFISLEHGEKLKNANVFRGDIIFTHAGNIGQAAYIPETSKYERYIISQRQFYMRCDKTKVLPGFVTRYFKTAEGRHKLLANASSVGVPSLARPVSYLRTIEIPIPPLHEQKTITKIFDAFDDKIELNRRMNQTLEAIAQAIFKSWFIDAIQSGLPKGWRKGPILELAKLMSGGTPKTNRKEYWDGDILWASAKDVSQCGQTFLVTTERTITTKGLDESTTQMIPAFCTVVVARGATTGRMILFGRNMAMNQTCYALATTTGTPFALYCMIRHEMSDLVQSAHGSVFDTITTSTFASQNIALPPKELLQQFEQTVTALFQRALTNTEESRTLATLRDTLLPKLISGELRVKDAEKFSRAG
ncbi:MAG TPA: restriction endonuclease subunit S [Phycisphaerae bacterium]|nr:restriction endonuclease subunit S [Phycisphaerae bacterium]